MARIRSLKPEHKQHRKIGPLTDRQYRLWVGMLTEADDYGRLVADANQFRVLAFAYHPRVRLEHVEEVMLALADIGLIELYAVDGIRYAAFLSWADHQKVDHPTPSKFPDPPVYHKSSVSNEVRREVAKRYGASPGKPVEVKCHYCEAPGVATLWTDTGWASFLDLELDHLTPERNGGPTTEANLVLSCRRCNRSKGNHATPRHIDVREPDMTSRESSRAFVSDLIGSDLIGSDRKGVECAVAPATEPTRVQFKIPEAIVSALNRAPRLGAVTRLRDPAWWQAIMRANRGVDYPAEVLKAEAYLVAHPERRYKDLGKFLHGWMGRADRSPA